MAMFIQSFIPIRADWSLFVISILCIHRILCARLSNYRSNITHIERNACEKECSCYSWRSRPFNWSRTSSNVSNATQEYDRFSVNCTGTYLENNATGLEYGFSRKERYIPSLPINITDLLVTGYHLDMLNINSFNHTPFKEPLINAALRYMGHMASVTLIRSFQKSLRHADMTIVYLRKLTSISVVNNHIYKVEKGSFRKVSQVKLINISHNFLKELEPGTFCEVQSLEVLDLSYNMLETLPWKNISQLSSLKVLGLKGNFWNCSCKMRDMLELNHSLLIGTQATCLFPVRLKGTLLEDLNSNTFSHCFTTETASQYVLVGRIKAAFPTLILSCLFVCYVYFRTGTKKQTACDIMRIGNIWFNSNDALDRFGMVYKGGLTDGREAAIKRHLKVKACEEMKCKACEELKFFLHLSNVRPHPNIIRYLWEDSDRDFRYLALELCAGDLMTAVMERVSGFDNIVDPQNYLLQLTSGISFLHENNIQHRDIKPQNILWKSTVNGIALVISDFDLSHLSEEKSSNNTMRGTKGWSAPELWHHKTRSNAVDLFSLGCVFYFILTRGHPFGAISDPDECHKNIISPEYKTTLAELYEHHNEYQASMAEDLIHRMILSSAVDRIKACEIRKHPLFWSRMEMKSFFNRIGNFMNDKVDPNVASFKKMLEEDASTVFIGSWMDKLHAVARSDLKSFRKDKQDQSICSLLLAIRNKIEHFEGIRKLELRRIYSGSTDGVVEYYTGLFPRLAVYTYRTLGRSELKL